MQPTQGRQSVGCSGERAYTRFLPVVLQAAAAVRDRGSSSAHLLHELFI